MSADLQRLKESIRVDMAPVGASHVLALIARLEKAEESNNSLARLCYQAMEWNWMDDDAPDTASWEEAIEKYSPLKGGSHE